MGNVHDNTRSCQACAYCTCICLYNPNNTNGRNLTLDHRHATGQTPCINDKQNDLLVNTLQQCTVSQISDTRISTTGNICLGTYNYIFCIAGLAQWFVFV